MSKHENAGELNLSELEAVTEARELTDAELEAVAGGKRRGRGTGPGTGRGDGRGGGREHRR